MQNILAFVGMMVLAAPSAQAVTVNLYGAGGGDANVSGKTATFEKNGISGTIEAFSTYSGATPQITTNAFGLGVKNGPNDVAYYPGNDTYAEGDYRSLGRQIDGRYQDDWLTFTFNKAVKLISLTLGNFNGSGPWYDNAYISTNGSETETNISTPLHSFGGAVATSFTVAARDYDDEFVAYSFEVAPVPLPASALLLIGGLAGFGVMHRRKTRYLKVS
ncbi:MAG: VPLPA-CTERM sorting domain-containing protein [Hyphomicrobiales bacterium]